VFIENTHKYHTVGHVCIGQCAMIAIKHLITFKNTRYANRLSVVHKRCGQFIR